MNRRAFLGATAGAALSTLLTRRVFAGDAANASPPIARSMIVLWMNGGPSHVDTWDPKPGTREGGPTKAIKTRLSGLEISEHMPRIADVADRLCVIRGMSGKEGNHQRAQYVGRTTYAPNPTVEHPSFGGWVAKLLGSPADGLPAFVSLGGPSRGAGFLGPQFGPFIVQKAGAVPEYASTPISEQRFDRRLALLDGMERRFSSETGGGMVDDRRALYAAAHRFMRSPDLKAFDLANESAAAKAAYGDTDFGRACMTARNLVKAGVRYVEVTLDGWDTHEDNFNRVHKQLDILDPAMSALIKDLETTTGRDGARLIDSTLVLWMGDFGRTPRITPNEGRGHHPQAWTAVLVGAKTKAGVLGQTDAAGEKVVGKPFAAADLIATCATRLGISPSYEAVSPIGRPIAVTDMGVRIAGASS